MPGASGDRVPLSVLHTLGLGNVGRVRRVLGVLVTHTGRGEHGLGSTARAVPTKLLLTLAATDVSLVFDLERKSLLVAHAGAPLTTRMLGILLIQ